ncbi:MAG: hypothetical protein PHE59_05205, partial [Patescibacteria group bacterium]|nr:hypothetical protein [Patescibacteria group bacterium]
RWTGISPAIDMTGKFFKLWVRIDDMANLNRLWLYAASTAWTALWTWKPSDAPSHWLDSGGAPHGSNATWIPISFSYGEAVVTGSPVRSSIVAFQLYAQDKNNIPVQINWGALYAIDETGNAVISFTFDDAWESIYTEGYAYLRTYGYPGVSYLTTSDLGLAGRMTQTSIDALHAVGWDISGHYETELDEVEDIGAALDSIQAYLSSHDYRGAKDFALPGGVWNETTVMPEVRARFRSNRTIIPYGETQPPGDAYKLRVMEVFNTTPLATVTGRVDRCKANHEWLILVFHKLVEEPSASIEWSIADFRSLVDYIHTEQQTGNTLDVKTVSEVLDPQRRSGITVNRSWDKNPLHQGLVLCLPFMEGQGAADGDQIRDIAWPHHKVDWVTAPSGASAWRKQTSGLWCPDFSSVYAKCLAADSLDLNFTSSDFSMAAWVQMDDVSMTMDVINRSNASGGWVFRFNGDNIQLSTYEPTARNAVAADCLTNNLWKMVGLSRMGTTVAISINAVAQTITSNDMTGNPASTPTADLYVGARGATPDRYINGRMMWVRIWNKFVQLSAWDLIFNSERRWFGV